MRTLFAMIATSTVGMYGLMYFNTYALDHVFFSQARFWMAVYMGAAMICDHAGFHANCGLNMAIFAGSAVVFAAALFLVRSQSTVDDASWMKAMNPHHSIAILTGGRASISDPRGRSLADDIIQAQNLEIEEMKALIVGIEGRAAATPEVDGE